MLKHIIVDSSLEAFEAGVASTAMLPLHEDVRQANLTLNDTSSFSEEADK